MSVKSRVSEKNTTTVEIKDELDLKKIMESGQAFRIREAEKGLFRFISGDHVLYIKQEASSENGEKKEKKNPDNTPARFVIETHSFQNPAVSAEDEWKNVWIPYFDLERNYRKIRESVPSNDSYLRQACENGKGLRILRQDPWEMLVSFIISQRKSIPAIKDSIERICEKYGKSVDTGREKLFLFPSAKDMKDATEEELTQCKLGYRVPYIHDAVNSVCYDSLDLYSLYKMSYEELFEKLKTVKGVGDKVSNCICLFAYSKTEAAPVDTWIAKVIEQKYAGVNPFPSYGDAAGIMQQYIFYYALTHKDSL